jgi:hypothetical protein
MAPLVPWLHVLRGNLPALLTLAMALGAAAGCDPDPPLTHLLIGQEYQASSNCLAASASIDVVDGPTPVPVCAPTCIVDPLGNTFVTQMCAPYPPLDTVEGPDAGSASTCALAVAAFVAGLTCGADAGVGMDAAGASDAAGDAAGDGAGE